MSDNVNEDLIEATIRRVAGDKAALKAAADEVSAEDAEEEDDEDAAAVVSPAGNDVDEDLIEATIRRVTASQRHIARLDDKPEAPPAEDAPNRVPAAWAEGERILRSLEETNTLLRSIAGRLEATVPHLERLARMSVPPAPGATWHARRSAPITLAAIRPPSPARRSQRRLCS